MTLDAGRAGRVGREGFWRPLAVAATSVGDPTTLQTVLKDPGVNIWPSPSGFVPLLGGAAGLLHGGDVERWVDRVIFSLVKSLLFY